MVGWTTRDGCVLTIFHSHTREKFVKIRQLSFTGKKVILRSVDSNSRSQIATKPLSKKQPSDHVRINARFTRVCVKKRVKVVVDGLDMF